MADKTTTRNEKEASIHGLPAMPVNDTTLRQMADQIAFGEGASEYAWMAPLVKDKVVVDLGCGLGLRAEYIATIAKFITAVDQSWLHASVTFETLEMNGHEEYLVTSSQHAVFETDVLIVDLQRAELPNIPASTVILLKPGAEDVKKALALGYKHLPEYTRAAVFGRPEH